jgi:hypothetical protein
MYHCTGRGHAMMAVVLEQASDSIDEIALAFSSKNRQQ